MSVEQKARALMSRHHHLIRNREQSMLLRSVGEIGLDVDVTSYHSQVKGMTPNNFGQSYDRSRSAMS
jgi:hypothetical protein